MLSVHFSELMCRRVTMVMVRICYTIKCLENIWVCEMLFGSSFFGKEEKENHSDGVVLVDRNSVVLIPYHMIILPASADSVSRFGV